METKIARSVLLPASFHRRLKVIADITGLSGADIIREGVRVQLVWLEALHLPPDIGSAGVQILRVPTATQGCPAQERPAQEPA